MAFIKQDPQTCPTRKPDHVNRKVLKWLADQPVPRRQPATAVQRPCYRRAPGVRAPHAHVKVKMEHSADDRANSAKPKANAFTTPLVHSALAVFTMPTGRPTENSRRAFLNNIHDNDLGIWKLQEATEYWSPALAHAEFCYRRRPGDVAGRTQQVILATRNGSYPAGKSPKEGTVVLRDWNEMYCFWTLDHNNKRYVVKELGKHSDSGAYWACWLGLKDRYDSRPIAYPIE
ncbi:MAG: hypothetical protein LQ352_007181, partial [Teloschistes flavicans]